MTGTWATGWATGDIVTAAEFKKSAGSIFDSALGASAASIDVTSISSAYAHLMITLYLRSDAAAGIVNGLMRFNGDTAANYDYQFAQGVAAAASAGETFAATSIQASTIPANTAGANLFGMSTIFIPNYANSTNNKQCICVSSFKSAATTGNMAAQIFGASWRSNAAINRVTILASSGNLVSGSRVTIDALGA